MNQGAASSGSGFFYGGVCPAGTAPDHLHGSGSRDTYGEHSPAGRWGKGFLYANPAFMGGLLGAPILALILRSIMTDSGFSLVYYLALFTAPARSVFFVPPGAAVVNSPGFALAAMVISVFLGLFTAAFLAQEKTRAKTILWEMVPGDHSDRPKPFCV